VVSYRLCVLNCGVSGWLVVCLKLWFYLNMKCAMSALEKKNRLLRLSYNSANNVHDFF
jgi:hypothetical protein